MAEFGSIGNVFAASAERLLRVTSGDHLAVRALTTFRDTMAFTLRSGLEERPLVKSHDLLLNYLRTTMAFRLEEQVRVLHLNAASFLIRDEVMFEGTIDAAGFYVREILRRAMELGTAAIIVVHNHPSGDPTPSREDIDITRKLAETAKRLDVRLYDHIVIATGGHSSMRAMGLL